MSVIIAVYDPVTCLGAMAADSQAQAGDLKLRSPDKVTRLGRVLFGCAGLVLARSWWHRQPGPADGQDVLSWAEEQQRAFRAWAVQSGHGETREGVWGLDFQGLALAEEGIVVLDACGGAEFAVAARPQDRLVYAAAGSGQMVALGALHVEQGRAKVVQVEAAMLQGMAYRAVAAACTHVVGCGGQASVRTLHPPPISEAPWSQDSTR